MSPKTTPRAPRANGTQPLRLPNSSLLTSDDPRTPHGGNWKTGRVRRITRSRKLHQVRYDVRGPILVEAQRLEAEGHKILKLNIGNPAPFGFEAPEAIVADMVHSLPDSQGYSDSKGIYSARTAVAPYDQSRCPIDSDVDDVYSGNGVLDQIAMVIQAFIDDGNE